MKKQSTEKAADAATETASTTKCPQCHAYFTEDSALCANCEAKQ